MIVIDEHFPESQRQLLKGWRIRFRQIGYEIGDSGLKDPEIIPLLLKQRRLTFFTLDSDFDRMEYCHTQAKRLGKVIRVKHTYISFRRRHAEEGFRLTWSD